MAAYAQSDTHFLLCVWDRMLALLRARPGALPQARAAPARARPPGVAAAPGGPHSPARRWGPARPGEQAAGAHPKPEGRR